MQDLHTPNGVEDLLDHSRTHFEPIVVFRRGRMTWSVKPTEEIREYDTRFNMLLRQWLDQ